ncbi:hypothetical protein E4631_25560 [Hymenobacter sp. UV11]|nr:hypothetical protein [Hymenobacter sp. UV11]TDN37234.1 hypothetical protein A8B98_04885 [Hymenobacter sp. UV11]TFZ62098.1 hypothetical protein E4631_25560 [Hymenobacter sp. UV11]
MTIPEQIQEVNDRLQYWEKEVEELAAMGKAEEIADVYQEAMGQVNLCLDELIYLQDELGGEGIKSQIDEVRPIGIKLYSLRFWADGPGGLLNKFFCYPVHHGRHTADLLMKFIGKGLTIKAAYLVGGSGGEKGVQLGRGELAYLMCTGEKEQSRIRAILLSKFPRLS